MVWSPKSAANAYIDTVKLCKPHHDTSDDDPCVPNELQANEFISALAAGMSAQRIVEVSSEASQSTVALAAAARQTGGRLVCILPEEKSLAASEQVVKESGLNEMVEFKVGDPYELLPEYENIDFSLVDCKKESNTGLLKLLDGEREGLGGELGCQNERCEVRSVKHPIGEGMEVTMIGKSDEFGVHGKKGDHEKWEVMGRRRHRRKSKWVTKFDESGEEHIFRIPNYL